ncbi:pyridoxal phosphate-dependent aminotransferase [Candidatus Solirubrobacter pratensis]|uniref:pyridoxal phosphate-dependent aminotransferase n=1 Tax=Candidatus Solirubrobacter pratensis TaxID=1298857 RepID=UPI00042719C1|nr:pyridoxal phosphate-dependent aminotransferase [Candidatus Solirubrobacter pratensis]
MTATRLAAFGTTIFTEMSALAQRTGAINLGQGFPDYDAPAEVLESAIAAMRTGHNQYAPLPGVPPLRQAIAEHQRRFYGIELDPDTQVQVTMGATEALTAAIIGICEPGDEVLAFDPYYDSYAPAAAMAGAAFSTVPLHPPDWRFDPDELAAAVTPRTRMLLLNTPHNPTGRVFGRAELEAVAAVCRERDLIAVTDEVYEHLVFDGEHVPLATLPGMAERTVTISSIGKTFSVTGWKTGWATGPAELVAAVRAAKQFLTFAGGTPFQYASAAALRLGDDWYAAFSADLARKRDHLCAALEKAGLNVLVPQGTYFANVEVEGDGADWCRALVPRAGVVAIPTSVFSTEPERLRPYVRFAFCKRLGVIDAAAARLTAAAAAPSG